MNNRPTPYIGITDFMTHQQARSMLTVMEKCQWGKAEDRKLMVGVMMSWKTFNGVPSRFTDAFPNKSDIPSIFLDHSLAFNTLHYADYDSFSTPHDISMVLHTCRQGGRLDAIQFDMVWPHRSLLERVKDDSDGMLKTVLQIGKNALEQCKNEPREVVRALIQHYGSSADYVLLDKSMGQGRGMDADVLLPFLRAIAAASPHLGLAVAGGLGPMTMHLVEPIVQEFPQVSIDAQGQLRSSGSALDPIEWDRAEAYLCQASALFP